MILVISSPSSSTTGFLTLIRSIPAGVAYILSAMLSGDCTTEDLAALGLDPARSSAERVWESYIADVSYELA